MYVLDLTPPVSFGPSRLTAPGAPGWSCSCGGGQSLGAAAAGFLEIRIYIYIISTSVFTFVNMYISMYTYIYVYYVYVYIYIYTYIDRYIYIQIYAYATVAHGPLFLGPTCFCWRPAAARGWEMVDKWLTNVDRMGIYLCSKIGQGGAPVS